MCSESSSQSLRDLWRGHTTPVSACTATVLSTIPPGMSSCSMASYVQGVSRGVIASPERSRTSTVHFLLKSNTFRALPCMHEPSAGNCTKSLCDMLHSHNPMPWSTVFSHVRSVRLVCTTCPCMQEASMAQCKGSTCRCWTYRDKV